MRIEKCLLVVVFLLILVPFAFSQEEIITLNNEVLGPHERPLVHFTHEKHAEVIECIRCHHDLDEYGNNAGSEGSPCSECHTQPNGGNPISLQNAFHQQCKSCHEQMSKKGTPTGPVICGECHLRTE